jgi:hypothetical protein
LREQPLAGRLLGEQQHSCWTLGITAKSCEDIRIGFVGDQGSSSSLGPCCRDKPSYRSIPIGLSPSRPIRLPGIAPFFTSTRAGVLTIESTLLTDRYAQHQRTHPLAVVDGTEIRVAHAAR